MVGTPVWAEAHPAKQNKRLNTQATRRVADCIVMCIPSLESKFKSRWSRLRFQENRSGLVSGSPLARRLSGEGGFGPKTSSGVFLSQSSTGPTVSEVSTVGYVLYSKVKIKRLISTIFEGCRLLCEVRIVPSSRRQCKVCGGERAARRLLVAARGQESSPILLRSRSLAGWCSRYQV